MAGPPINKSPLPRRRIFTTARAGFVWDAYIALFPGVPVREVDGFIAGEGLLRPIVMGLCPIGTQQGTGEIARGELLRHFAECGWLPTALLPGQGVNWQAVDDTSTKATMTDGPIRVYMLFRFDAGLIASIYVEGRATIVDGATVLMPWQGRMSKYQTQDGMCLPLTAEVQYITPQGDRPYCKGTIETIAYEFAE